MPILYLFYNTDLLKICCATNAKNTTKRFIDNVFLLVTSLNILENYRLLKKVYLLCMAWANCYKSKFDLLKYQLVYLSQKKNIDLKTNLVLSSYIIKAKTLNVFLGVEIDNSLR